ncbi:hypothetical protein B5G43_12610 [Flavonifractor sp. An92]|uniref:hypothetical protein n=1 Tax=Flavonifractor sp. An92 TaxID=1965666 RepID=UPI000B396054|nr:hypothetical protein [Flavonifractor sp. An92]OUN05521.1 hypothetical protein B5G43_12610 [Flavonifractor sp. An92]
MTWYEQAEARLKDEYGKVKGQKEGVMKSAVRDALLEFCRQNEEFAQAVAQGGSFPDCMTAVAKGVGSSLSDLEAYRQAAAFYFDGAKVHFTMTIQLEPAEPEPERTGILLDLSDFF